MSWWQTREIMLLVQQYLDNVHVTMEGRCHEWGSLVVGHRLPNVSIDTNQIRARLQDSCPTGQMEAIPACSVDSSEGACNGSILLNTCKGWVVERAVINGTHRLCW
jgi:hypothetical protein